MAGAGMGLMLGQANTDAINRASRYSYGQATGVTQTVRNYGASLGFAVLGTLLTTRLRSEITSSLTAQGLPRPAAATQASEIAQLRGGNGYQPVPATTEERMLSWLAPRTAAVPEEDSQ